METNDSALLIMFFSVYTLSSRPEPEAAATKKQKLDVSWVLYMLEMFLGLNTKGVIERMMILKGLNLNMNIDIRLTRISVLCLFTFETSNT